MITRELLDYWMMENGEDVLVDGPFNLNDGQRSEFLDIIKNDKKVIKHLIKDGFIDDVDELDDFDQLGVGSTDKSSTLILKRFVKFLNREGIIL